MVERAVEALRAGEAVILPTDTVYGLCAAPEHAARLAELKGRPESMPVALLCAKVERLLELVPGAAGCEAVLPGPYTLILPNPARRFAWLTGERPESIGARVPVLTGPTAEIVGGLGAVVATSANLAGEPDPRLLADVPSAIVGGVVVALDGGELPGVPSTVIDVTGAEPAVLRVGLGDPEAAVRRIVAEGRPPVQ